MQGNAISFPLGAGLQDQMAFPSKPLVHLELHTGDLRGARDFYAQHAGWRPERVDVGTGRSYLSLSMGRGLGGGIVECDIDRPAWLPYVEVSDVCAATEGARQAGAEILLPPREGPAGWRSVVRTPAGGELAFWQAKR
jgi:predicted enzyme related to lactoylglutathione lyase